MNYFHPEVQEIKPVKKFNQQKAQGNKTCTEDGCV